MTQVGKRFLVDGVEYVLECWSYPCVDNCCFDYGWKIYRASDSLVVYEDWDCPENEEQIVRSWLEKKEFA